MKTDTHPDTDALIAWLRDGDSGDSSLTEHLQHCDECNEQLFALQSVTTVGTTGATDELNEQQHRQIIDFVEGRLSGSAQAEAERLIHEHPQAQKAALHYASHRAAMSVRLADEIPAATPRSAGKPLLEQLQHWLRNRIPAWTLVPVAVSAALLAVVAVQLTQPPSPSLLIASYQDNPVLRIHSRNTVPGIGFFSQAENRSTPYNNVQLSLNRSPDGNASLQIQWPRVDGATEYTLRLQVFDGGDKQTLAEITTQNNTASFSIGQPKTGKRYEWVLTGNTDDNKTFYTSGGFIIKQVQ